MYLSLYKPEYLWNLYRWRDGCNIHRWILGIHRNRWEVWTCVTSNNPGVFFLSQWVRAPPLGVMVIWRSLLSHLSQVHLCWQTRQAPFGLEMETAAVILVTWPLNTWSCLFGSDWLWNFLTLGPQRLRAEEKRDRKWMKMIETSKYIRITTFGQPCQHGPGAPPIGNALALGIVGIQLRSLQLTIKKCIRDPLWTIVYEMVNMWLFNTAPLGTISCKQECLHADKTLQDMFIHLCNPDYTIHFWIQIAYGCCEGMSRGQSIKDMYDLFKPRMFIP